MTVGLSMVFLVGIDFFDSFFAFKLDCSTTRNQDQLSLIFW